LPKIEAATVQAWSFVYISDFLTEIEAFTNLKVQKVENKTRTKACE